MGRPTWITRGRGRKAHPTGADLLGAGRSHLTAGDPATATTWFQGYMDRYPARHEGIVGLARCAEAEGDWDRAAELWGRLVDAGRPDAPAFWHTQRLRSLRWAGRTEEFRSELAAGRAGDPALRRYDEATANPPGPPAVTPRFRHIVIVTYGRSGSTLLQGVLNTIDGVLVRGENDNLFLDLLHLARRIRAVRKNAQGGFTAQAPWFGADELSDTVILEALRLAARRLLLGDQVDDPGIVTLGFKEIRFSEVGADLEEYLDFLSELLPETAFVINTRDLDRTVRSGWWAERPADEVRSELESFEQRLFAFASAREDCFHIRYEDVIDAGPRLGELFAFLGVPYDLERVRIALQVPHSFQYVPVAERGRSAPRRPAGRWPRVRSALMTLRRQAVRRLRRTATLALALTSRRRTATLALERIRSAERRGDPRGALDIAERELRRSPTDAALAITTSRLLCAWARWDDAAAVLDALPDTERDRVDIEVGRAAVERSRDEHRLALDRLERALTRCPADLRLLRARFDTLVDTGRFDDAELTLDAMVAAHPDLDPHREELLLLEGLFEHAQVLAHVEARARDRPDDLGARVRRARERFRISRFVLPGLPDWDETAEDDLGRLVATSPQHPGVARLALDVAIAAEDVDRVQRILDLLPDDSTHRFIIESRAWVAARLGRPAEEVRRIWAAVEAHHPLPQLRAPSEGELVPVGRPPVASEPGAITLFTVVRDEAPRLPWFLDHYRRLGVDRFVIVDNASTDGTQELLRGEPDVSVLFTQESYARARSGVVWLNHLMAELGSHGWNLYVDVDEALVFPGSEELDLRYLVEHLDRNGHEVVAGQMVDMFSAGTDLASAGPTDWADPLGDHPLFNTSYRRTGKAACPYVTVFGGARAGLGLLPEQTKTPLIRGGRGIRLLGSSHAITPAAVSDVTCALLHFKLAGDFRATFEQDVRNNHRRPHCTRRHLAYLAALDRLSTAHPDLTDGTTVRYRSTRTLVEHGIISAPRGFGPERIA